MKKVKIPEYIIINVYHYIDEDGRIIFNFEDMLKDYEEEIKDLEKFDGYILKDDDLC